MVSRLRHREFETGVGEFWMTDASDADLTTRQSPEDLHRAQQAAVPGTWSWLRQVHSDRVVRVDAPGARAGEAGDGLVTNVPGAVIAVQVADCVPVGLWSGDGTIAVVHAGWRGALLGVIEAAVRTMSAGAAPVEAFVGPHICASCYEFGARDLFAMRRRFGRQVEQTTRDGTPALDMTAVIAAELDRLGVTADFSAVECTSCAGTYWSHRARAETGRQSMIGVVR